MQSQFLDTPNTIELASTLIEITRSVTHGAETIEIFTDLAERCVSLLPVSAAGILLRDASGTLQVIGASNASAHLLDLFQVQNDEGPCLDCSNSGLPVSDAPLGSSGTWPRFSQMARASGFHSAYALLLTSRDVTVGALNLFGTKPLSAGQLVIAQTLADTATLSLLQVDPHVDLHIVIRRIHVALESRNTVEQAQGMVAQRFAISPEGALLRMREVSVELDLSLIDVATSVVTRNENSPAAARLRKID